MNLHLSTLKGSQLLREEVPPPLQGFYSQTVEMDDEWWSEAAKKERN